MKISQKSNGCRCRLDKLSFLPVICQWLQQLLHCTTTTTISSSATTTATLSTPHQQIHLPPKRQNHGILTENHYTFPFGLVWSWRATPMVPLSIALLLQLKPLLLQLNLVSIWVSPFSPKDGYFQFCNFPGFLN